MHDLGEHVEWIHLDEFDFELCHLRDAAVVTPTWDDFSAYTSTLVDLVYESTAIRAIGTGLHPEFVRALRDATVEGDLTLDLVYEPDVIAAIEADTDVRRLVVEMADTDRANVYRYEGSDSLMMLGIHETRDRDDDVVLLCGQHDEGAPPGTVESTDTSVRSWAESYFETVLADSQPLDTDSFAVERSGTT